MPAATADGNREMTAGAPANPLRGEAAASRSLNPETAVRARSRDARSSDAPRLSGHRDDSPHEPESGIGAAGVGSAAF
jgi:hypothetical protein